MTVLRLAQATGLFSRSSRRSGMKCGMRRPSITFGSAIQGFSSIPSVSFTAQSAVVPGGGLALGAHLRRKPCARHRSWICLKAHLVRELLHQVDAASFIPCFQQRVGGVAHLLGHVEPGGVLAGGALALDQADVFLPAGQGDQQAFLRAPRHVTGTTFSRSSRPSAAFTICSHAMTTSPSAARMAWMPRCSSSASLGRWASSAHVGHTVAHVPQPMHFPGEMIGSLSL